MTTAANAATALTNVKAAITQLASDRSTVGASNARLKYTSEQLGVLSDNLAASNSRIKDTDVMRAVRPFTEGHSVPTTIGSRRSHASSSTR